MKFIKLKNLPIQDWVVSKYLWTSQIPKEPYEVQLKQQLKKGRKILNPNWKQRNRSPQWGWWFITHGILWWNRCSRRRLCQGGKSAFSFALWRDAHSGQNTPDAESILPEGKDKRTVRNLILSLPNGVGKEQSAANCTYYQRITNSVVDSRRKQIGRSPRETRCPTDRVRDHRNREFHTAKGWSSKLQKPVRTHWERKSCQTDVNSVLRTQKNRSGKPSHQERVDNC